MSNKLNKLYKIFYLISRSPLFLIIDLGTTNIKGFLIDKNLKIYSQIFLKNKTFYPKLNWAEQNPTEWFFKIQKIIGWLSKNKNIKAIGITGQRETIVAWDKNSGMTIYPAILWCDQRTKELSKKFVKLANNIRKTTGLFWHPRYPALKIHWILNNVDNAQILLKQKRLAFGLPASWLVYNLSEERSFVIDHTLASHSMLYNLKQNSWDKDLLNIFGIPLETLPKIKPNFYYFGSVKIKNKKIPIFSLIGDQEASLFLYSEKPRVTKLTLGSGIFMQQDIGSQLKRNKNFETSVALSLKKTKYMWESRFNLSGKELFQAIKNNNKSLINKFKKALKKNIKTFSPQFIYVDGGLLKQDQWGQRVRKMLNKISPKFVFQNPEGTALGTAKILKTNLK